MSTFKALPKLTETAEPGEIPEGFPAAGALLGLDHGEKRLGLALSNPEQSVAMPLETYHLRSERLLIEKLRSIVMDYRVAGLVVGLPLRMNGEEGDQSKHVREWASRVAEWTARPVAFWDERLSSTAASLLLWERGITPRAGKGRLDELAAQLILKSFLERPRTNAAASSAGAASSVVPS